MTITPPMECWSTKIHEKSGEGMSTQSDTIVDIQGLNKWFGALHVLKTST